jgi:hypothetical protein
MAYRRFARSRDTGGTAMKPTTAIRFELECGCQRSFDRGVSPPRIGDVIYCSGHRDVALITARVDEYRIECTECNYRRYFGQAKINAQLSADKHVRRKGHKVNLYWSKKLVDTMGSQQNQLQLALNLDK